MTLILLILLALMEIALAVWRRSGAAAAKTLRRRRLLLRGAQAAVTAAATLLSGGQRWRFVPVLVLLAVLLLAAAATLLCRAAAGFSTAIRDTKHMDFTDLPLLSPALGRMLGSGTRDTAEAMTVVNSLVLRFFDCYLKGEGAFTVQDTY